MTCTEIHAFLFVNIKKARANLMAKLIESYEFPYICILANDFVDWKFLYIAKEFQQEVIHRHFVRRVFTFVHSFSSSIVSCLSVTQSHTHNIYIHLCRCTLCNSFSFSLTCTHVFLVRWTNMNVCMEIKIMVRKAFEMNSF